MAWVGKGDLYTVSTLMYALGKIDEMSWNFAGILSNLVSPDVGYKFLDTKGPMKMLMAIAPNDLSHRYR